MQTSYQKSRRSYSALLLTARTDPPWLHNHLMDAPVTSCYSSPKCIHERISPALKNFLVIDLSVFVQRLS